MRIKYKAKAKGHWSKAKRDAVKAASRWASKQLGLSLLPITVTIRFVGENENNEYGSCGMISQTDYVIWLHSGFSIGRTLSTLFHELTHVHQHWYEGLELIDYGTAYYMNEKHSDVGYWTAPWEVAARESEKKLMKKYYSTKAKNS